MLAEIATSGNWIAKSPEVAIGMVKAPLSAPPNYVLNNVATVFNATDLVAARTNKSEAVAVAQAMIMELRQLGRLANISAESPWHRISGAFERGW